MSDIEIAKQALTRIAADHEITTGGQRKRLSRYVAINIAREACEKLGWQYGKHSMERN